MSDFTIRSDSVDVEQIMRQIRARIREKRGVDYTEEEVRELATVKLEKFLDPKNVRSDLIEHYRRQRGSQPFTITDLNYGFEDATIYLSSRSLVGRTIRLIRRMLNPVLKLFFNPNPIIHVLHQQGRINERVAQRLAVRDELDTLNYEVLNNLVVELTRLGIEVKNLKMRVESIASRLDFDERRARALEGVVQYRTGAQPPPPPPAKRPGDGAARPAGAAEGRRRRRRRRGRGGGGAARVDSHSAGGPAQSDATSPAAGDAAAPDRPEPARGDGGGPDQ